MKLQSVLMIMPLIR